MHRRFLRIPSKPFVSTSAVSHALMRAGQQAGFEGFQLENLWVTSGDHYSSQQLAHLFESVIKEGFYESLFLPDIYWVDGSKLLFGTGGKKSIAIRVLGECLYRRAKTDWLSSGTSATDLSLRMNWNEFNFALLKRVVTDGHVSGDLAALMLERDLGL